MLDIDELLELLAVDECRARGAPSTFDSGAGVNGGVGVEAVEIFCRTFESSAAKFEVSALSLRRFCNTARLRMLTICGGRLFIVVQEKKSVQEQEQRRRQRIKIKKKPTPTGKKLTPTETKNTDTNGNQKKTRHCHCAPGSSVPKF